MSGTRSFQLLLRKSYICQIGGGSISNGVGWAASAAITGTVLLWPRNNHRQNLPSG